MNLTIATNHSDCRTSVPLRVKFKYLIKHKILINNNIMPIIHASQIGII